MDFVIIQFNIIGQSEKRIWSVGLRVNEMKIHKNSRSYSLDSDLEIEI